MIDNSDAVNFGIPKIKNGSRIKTGKKNPLNFIVDHHFNHFLLKLIKWCFGFVVEDYDEK